MKLFSLIPTGWEICQLHKVAQKCTKKNKDHNISLVLTNSAVHGVVPQSEHFNKEIATDENIRGYYVIEPGEFVYNPRISVTAPCGPIRRNHLRFRGVMSPLYTIFKLKNGLVDDRYLEYYFLSPSWHKFAKSVANYGARHDRMAIKDDDFFAMPIPLPPLPEQKRIAEILIEQDKLIALKERLIAAKKKQKKWLMQNLLTSKIRLEGFSGEWQEKLLEEVVIFYDNLRVPVTQSLRKSGKVPYYGANGIQDYVSDFTHEGEFVLVAEDGANDLLEYPVQYVNGKIWVNNHVHVFQGILNQANTKFLAFILAMQNFRSIVVGTTRVKLNGGAIKKHRIRIPMMLSEQTAIAERLTAADQEIELLTKELEAQKQIKKYLMQQLLTGKIRVTGGES